MDKGPGSGFPYSKGNANEPRLSHGISEVLKPRHEAAIETNEVMTGTSKRHCPNPKVEVEETIVLSGVHDGKETTGNSKEDKSTRGLQNVNTINDSNVTVCCPKKDSLMSTGSQGSTYAGSIMGTYLNSDSENSRYITVSSIHGETLHAGSTKDNKIKPDSHISSNDFNMYCSNASSISSTYPYMLTTGTSSKEDYEVTSTPKHEIYMRDGIMLYRNVNNSSDHSYKLSTSAKEDTTITKCTNYLHIGSDEGKKVTVVSQIDSSVFNGPTDGNIMSCGLESTNTNKVHSEDGSKECISISSKNGSKDVARDSKNLYSGFKDINNSSTNESDCIAESNLKNKDYYYCGFRYADGRQNVVDDSHKKDMSSGLKSSIDRHAGSKEASNKFSGSKNGTDQFIRSQWFNVQRNQMNPCSMVAQTKEVETSVAARGVSPFEGGTDNTDTETEMPLSQETFDLLRTLKPLSSDELYSIVKKEYVEDNERTNATSSRQEQSTPKETDNGLIQNINAEKCEKLSVNGKYLFKLQFESDDAPAKSCKFTYSETLKKLFAQMDKFIPVNFRFDIAVPARDTEIRSYMIYKDEESRDLVVDRCPHHLNLNMNDAYPHHIIDTLDGEHCICPSTTRYVTVLKPSVTNNTRDINTFAGKIRFRCMSSCRGGIDRRSIVVLFELYVLGKFSGRAVLEVSICTSPGRDRCNQERKFLMKSTDSVQTTAHVNGSNKRPQTTDNNINHDQSTNFLYGPSPNGEYYIRVKGFHNAVLLRDMAERLNELEELRGMND